MENPEDSGAPGMRLQIGGQVYKPIMDLLNDCERGTPATSEIGTIVLDSYTALGQMLMYEILGGFPNPSEGRKADFDQWGELLGKFQDITHALHRVPKHVVCTALTFMDKDAKTGAYRGRLDIMGSFRERVGAMFNEVYYIQKRRARTVEQREYNREDVFEFFTQYHDDYNVKSRLARKCSIPPKMLNPTFKELYKEAYFSESV